MASLNLLPRKAFEILLDDGSVVRGQYSTWSLNRFCLRKKLSLAQLVEKASEDKLELDDSINMILCAVEYIARKENKGFSFTDLDVCEWIEQLGGIGSENFVKLASWGNTEETGKETEEKKSQLSSATS